MSNITDQEWTGNDAAILNDFISKNPKFLKLLKREAPKVSKAENIEARAMSGSEVKGAADILDLIEEMRVGFKPKNHDNTKFIPA